MFRFFFFTSAVAWVGAAAAGYLSATLGIRTASITFLLALVAAAMTGAHIARRPDDEPLWRARSRTRRAGVAAAPRPGGPRRRVRWPAVIAEIAGIAGIVAFIWFSASADLEDRSGRGDLQRPQPAAATPERDLALQGSLLYRRLGCANCHGPAGRGGVSNPNSATGEIPPLDLMAERLMLFEKEQADLVIGKLEEGADLEELASEPPFDRYPVFLAQYQNVRRVIEEGSLPGKEDPNGLPPPLVMRSWGDLLDDEEIDALIAYLISEYDWEE